MHHAGGQTSRSVLPPWNMIENIGEIYQIILQQGSCVLCRMSL